MGKFVSFFFPISLDHDISHFTALSRLTYPVTGCARIAFRSRSRRAFGRSLSVPHLDLRFPIPIHCISKMLDFQLDNCSIMKKKN